MSKRELDELAEIIWDKTDGEDESAPDLAAAAIYAAGYRNFIQGIAEVKKVGDLTKLDEGRNVRYMGALATVSGRLGTVAHQSIPGWAVGGETMTNKAFTLIEIGGWSKVLYYDDSITFLPPTAHVIVPEKIDLHNRWQCAVCHSWIKYSEATGKWEHA